jgi:hypothetical protein
MTTKPGRSHLLHSGFIDLASLIASTPSRIAGQSRLWAANQPAPPLGDDWSIIGVPYENNPAKGNVDPSAQSPAYLPSRGSPAARGGKAGGMARGGRAAAAGELRRRKVDKRMIGPPTDFRWASREFTGPGS